VNVEEATLAKQADLTVKLNKHRHNLKECLLNKLKLAQHVYEERHRVIWDEAKILEMQGICPYGVLDNPDQPTKSGYLSHLDPPCQRWGDQT
jgi:hypothetical protein